MGTPDDSATSPLDTRFLWVLLVIAVIVASGAIIYSVIIKPPEPLPYTAGRAPDRFLVKFKPGTSAQAMSTADNTAGATQIGRVPKIGVRIMRVAQGKTPEQMIAIYSRNPNVSFAEPDYVQKALLTPNDVSHPKNATSFSRIAAPTGWDVTAGSQAVTIAIIDTGVDASHPDLAGRVDAGYDVVNSDADASDDNGHGTLAAGIAAATGNNVEGIAGLNWKARIMPVKVLDANAAGTDSGVATGIIWAVDNGADVLNLSLGGPAGSATMQSAVDYAAARGRVLAAAAGNSGVPGVYFPAAYSQCIAVGALNGDLIAGTSSSGPEVDVVAPGVGVYSTAKGGGYAYFSGTSAATPFISGVAAMMIGLNADLWPDVVSRELTSTATDLGAAGFDEFYGWGRIDVEKALRATGGTGGAPAPDLTAPTVALTSPANGATVSGTINLNATAADDTGIARVVFYVDGSAVGTATASPYSVSWVTTKVANGSHTLLARAFDAAGNTAGSQALVNVSNTTTKRRR